ncbi:MAG: Panacea domain-containing protein [Methanotrichaceae archaeon]|nr:Panacea domain-containing protein [Methanotrichaceae archaeon]
MDIGCFSERTATELAGCFLKLGGNRMNYTKLTKLLYVVERQAIAKWGYSVTHDDLFWLKKGPVLSNTLDLIRHDLPKDSFWKRFIVKRQYDVVLIDDPGREHLSDAVVELVNSTWKTFGEFTWEQIVDILHEKLPERRDLKNGRERISLDEILCKMSKTASSKLIEEVNAFHRALTELSMDC